MPLFDDDAVKRIQRVVRLVESTSAPTAYPSSSQAHGSQAAWFRTPSTGIVARSGSTMGTATCDRRKLNTSTRQLANYQVAGVTQTGTLFNPFDWTIPGSLDVVADLVDGSWIMRPDYVHYKRLIKFSLSSALTTSDASKTGTISAQYGPGQSNPNTSSGQITVYNLYNGTSYVFAGANGKVGYAIHHDANNYYIVQMECA